MEWPPWAQARADLATLSPVLSPRASKRLHRTRHQRISIREPGLLASPPAPTFPLRPQPALPFLPLQEWEGGWGGGDLPPGNVTLRPQNSSWTQAQGPVRDRTRLRGSKALRVGWRGRFLPPAPIAGPPPHLLHSLTLDPGPTPTQPHHLWTLESGINAVCHITPCRGQSLLWGLRREGGAGDTPRPPWKRVGCYSCK